jgi:nucleoside 2-deoxyribosyltransferase
MTWMPSLYLAGPDVFEPDAAARFETMKRICARHGATGLSPLDAPGGAPLSGRVGALAIFDRNAALIAGCDAVIANVTTFRGPSADVGTALEIGMAYALGRPVFGYSRVALEYRAKVTTTPPAAGQGDGLVAADGFAIEDFGMFDNLMIVGAIERSGGTLIFGEAGLGAGGPGADLDLFERCVAEAALLLRVSPMHAPPAGAYWAAL